MFRNFIKKLCRVHTVFKVIIFFFFYSTSKIIKSKLSVFHIVYEVNMNSKMECVFFLQNINYHLDPFIAWTSI